MQSNSADYHPATPDSPLANSLHRATSTIDELTLALTNFSRLPSPEPQSQISCCCGNDTCESTRSWLALKSKLESRLILSAGESECQPATTRMSAPLAEVGSALLQRHEAYVRRHESNTAPRKATQDSILGDAITNQEEDAQTAELLKENTVLEKRLMQAILNNEVAEASNKTLLQELEDARSQVSKLSAYHTRTVGLDSRLSAVLQENDDIQQERDSQTQRAELAEARLIALKNRTDKLQAEVCRLQDDLESRRLQRLESSESLLQDVRSKLEGLQISHATKSTAEDDLEITKVVESLAADNELLKADNRELYKLLTESREDLQALQTGMGEQSTAPLIRVEVPSKQSRMSSEPSSFAKDSLFSTMRRPCSVESRSHRAYEPLTPETGHRPLSPADSVLASIAKYTTFVHPIPRYPLSHLGLDVDNEPEYDQSLLESNQATKAVQTDRWLALHGTCQPPSTDQVSVFTHDAHSDSSSLLDGMGSPLSSLLERMHSLLHRMTQADALTLTNRLKRQHLRGADVKHLSRTTIDNILSEVTHVRAQHRVWLEDDKITTQCTRKDLRGLLKLFKEALEEMGQMRVTLNDVILDPTIAIKVSEMALDPAKSQGAEKERKAIGINANWMAPLSKLFSSSHDANSLPSVTSATPRPASRGRGNTTRISRSAPKIGPALAASATTVNVEFSGTGAGKSVTSIFSAHPNDDETHSQLPHLRTLPHSSAPTQTSIRNVMDIFAGAPHIDDTSEPWVVLPRAPRRVQSAFLVAEPAEPSPAIIGRSTVRKRELSQLSRDVDAVLDASVSNRSVEHSEEDDIPGPLLERTLRRRGLSDSSIHSTFMNQDGRENDTRSAEPIGPWLERTSVLRTLSRTVQNFKQVASHTISGVAQTSQVFTHDLASSPSDPHPQISSYGPNIPHAQPSRVTSPTHSLLVPSLTPSAAIGMPFDHSRGPHGKFQEDAGVPRLFGREGQGRMFS